MRTSLVLFTALALTHSALASVSRVDPNVTGGSYLADRRDVNKSLIQREDVETDVTTSSYIDLSPAAASAKFREMMAMEALEGERNIRMKYVMHNNIGDDPGSNRLLESWAMTNLDNGLHSLTVVLRMLDLNNLELKNGIKENVFEFTCKYYKAQDICICKPEKCDFMNVKPPTDPVQICVNNYRQSQMVLDTVNVASQTQKPDVVGEELQNLIVLCMEQKIETLTIHGESICYYKGFEPENIVTYEDIKGKITSEPGWAETDVAGTFQRTTTIKEWEIVSKIDTSIPKLIEENTEVLKNVDSATLENILQQVKSTEIDLTKATVIEASSQGP